MRTYTMRRFTLVAPHVTNDGEASGYPAAVREALLAAGYDGWTEYESHGVWRGKREAGTTFEILRPVAETRCAPGQRADVLVDVDGLCTCHVQVTLRVLGRIGRLAMPDQEAVQVTLEPGTVTVTEA